MDGRTVSWSTGWLWCATALLLAPACGDSAAGPGDQDVSARDDGEPAPIPPGTMSAEAAKQVFDEVAAVIAADTRTASTEPLAPEVYDAIADAIAKVPGVAGAEYVADSLGTVMIAVENGGGFVWRHIENDFFEADALPDDFDLRAEHDADYQPEWVGSDTQATPTTPAPPDGARPAAVHENRFASAFPVASLAPDPDFASDVQDCPNGKIALIDFEWSHDSTDPEFKMRDPANPRAQYVVDGVPFFERLARMGEAAGYKVDIFHDDDINVGNFKQLEDYAIVVTNGHGGRPGPRAKDRKNRLEVFWKTHELFDPNKLLSGSGLTYHDAWLLGYVSVGVPSNKIQWRPTLLRHVYKPKGKQLWMQNECWGMLSRMVVGYHAPGALAILKWYLDLDEPESIFSKVDNFGKALRDAGVHSVTGYITPATPEDVVVHTMTFFRRLFGGNSRQDPPPEPFAYWPTCMSAQTYFRPSWDLFGQTTVSKFLLGHGVHPTLFTLYSDPEPAWFRRECDDNANAHAAMQAQLLTFGTPSTQIVSCWDGRWSKGEWPNPIEDQWCAQGDRPTTAQASHDAACAITAARKVTNAFLTR